MDVLVVGWSDIVRRRVLPALDGLSLVSAVHVASSAGRVDLAGLSTKAGRTFTGPMHLEEALEAFPLSLVYVSGRNDAHAHRALAALESGHDVIIDKPAFLTTSARDSCLHAARAGGLLLTEATVWPFHAQVVELRRVLAHEGLHATRIASTFTIPALPETNFRTQTEMGGGAVADMGAYAMSPGRVFGTAEHVEVTAAITQRFPSGLDLGFRVLARYADGLVVSGEFSMDAQYTNRLELAGDGWTARLEPAFSSRPDASLTVSLTVDGTDMSFEVEPCDAFERYLRSVIESRTTGDRAAWTQCTGLATADLLDLARASGVQWPGPRVVH